MTLKDISHSRLIHQQIVNPKFTNIKNIVGWMGAIQAQDYNMAKWAIGSRLPYTVDSLIETSIEKAEIIRTHILRPTWHLVSSDDIYWMLMLSAPQIKSATKSRDKNLGITESIYEKSNMLFEKILDGGKQLTRAEIVKEFTRAHLDTESNRLNHFLMRAEIEGIIFSRNSGSNKQTYSLLRENVPHTKTVTRDEALANLAHRYFSSHGPATIQDFSWWSGLSVTESKRALEMVKQGLISETIENQVFWFSSSFSFPEYKKDTLFLLPAFDEFIISYRNRTASIPLEYQNKAFSSNGIFRPVIVANGQVIGIWKRTIKKDEVFLETEWFQSKDIKFKDKILETAKPYGNFLNKKVGINNK
jgi:hypothetical protein